MIRFRTIEPDQVEKPVSKPQAQPAAAPPAREAPEADADESVAKPKGLTRKTPLRAKSSATSGLFRD